MKDGVEYVLRFGAPTTVASESKPGDTKDAGSAEAGKYTPGETSGRYLLVMARFNEKLLEKPTLDPLPEVPAAADDATQKVGDTPKDEQKAGEEAPSEEKPDAAESLKKADEAEAAAQVALENRRQVERENRRKQDDYDEKVKAAQKRVRELNGRFADWYYVVSDKEYAKIHLGRDSMVQQVEAGTPSADAAVPAGAQDGQ
jgi:hypothetical protein